METIPSQSQSVPVGGEVWLLSIHHRHGTNHAICASLEGAEKALQAYVDDCRDPDAEDTSVEAYFAATAGDEWYEIDPWILEP